MGNTVDIIVPQLYPTQLGVANNPTRFRVINAGRRWGKNVLMLQQSMMTALEGKRVGWLSTTYKQLEEDWQRAKDHFGDAIRDKSEQKHTMTVGQRKGELIFWSAERPAEIRGGSYDLFIVNEAAFVPDLLDTWNKIIRPTLMDRKGRGIFCSTPNGINDFHAIWSKADGANKDWMRWHFSTYDNPYIDPVEIDEMKEALTEEDFNQEVLAQFIEGQGAVFRNILSATSAYPSTPDDHKGHIIVGGLDWGKSNDFTVAMIGCATCKRAVDIDRFNTIDWYFQSQRIEAMQKKWNIYRWRVEANSMGGPMLEALYRKGLPVIAWTASNQTKGAMIESYSMGLETGDVVQLDHEVIRQELQAYRSHKTKTGLRSYSAPSGYHDDTVMSGGLMFLAMNDAKYHIREKTSGPTPAQINNQKIIEAMNHIF